MPVNLTPDPSKRQTSMTPAPVPDADADSGAAGIKTVYSHDDPFDARPADTPRPEGWLDKAIAQISRISSACDAAARWIHGIFGSEKGMTMDGSGEAEVSRPFNVKKLPLPHDMELANTREAEKARAQSEAQKARTDFVQGVDKPLAPAPLFVDADAKDFEHYLKLCDMNKSKPGDMACPANFLPGIQRHAKAFIALVDQRQATAKENGSEFILSTADQQKREALAKLLAQSEDKQDAAIGKQALKAGPTQAVTTQQLTSFMQWREWRNQGYGKGQPAPQIDLDAAIAYAKELLETYKNADKRSVGGLNDMLDDAESLVENPEMHRILLDSASPPVQGPAIDANEASSAQAVKQEEVGDQPKSATKRDMPDGARAMPKQADAAPAMPRPAPPAPAAPPVAPAPRSRNAADQQQLSLGEHLGLPKVSEMSMEDIEHATDLFNRFTQEFARAPQGVKLDRNSPYLYPECVAVANDFAEMVALAPDMKLSRDQLARLQAALKLRELFSQYRQDPSRGQGISSN